MRVVRLKLNGDAVEVAAPDHWTLLEVLRYRAGLTGTKQGCDKGDCGACTRAGRRQAVLSCLTLGRGRRRPRGHDDRGPGAAQSGAADLVQDCFDRCGALQCGFCQPGMMLAARGS